MRNILPIALLAGGAALLLGDKKKKGTSGPTISSGIPGSGLDSNLPPGDHRILLNETCDGFAHRTDPVQHNNYITNRYLQMVSEGATDPREMAIQMLSEQSPHCPWGDESQWTPFMREIVNQLHNGVKEFHSRQSS